MFLTVINCITNGILFSLFQYVFIKKITKTKFDYNKILLILISILGFTLISIIPIKFNVLKIVLYFCIFYILTKLYTNANYNNCLIQSCIEIIIISLCFILANTFKEIINYSNIIESAKISSIIFNLFFKVLISVAILFIIIFKPKLYYMQEIDLLKQRQIVFFSIISLIVVILQISITNLNTLSITLTILIFALFCILDAYTLLSLYLNIQIQKYKEKNFKLETDNKAMLSLIDGVRTVKHDFGNIFQTINGYLCEKNYSKLETYIDSIMKEFSILNNISSLNDKIFDDPGIYGIIGSKQFYANSKGILFDLDVTVKISDINFYKPDLSRIFGILLDNAIEAVQKTDNKYIKLEIHYNSRRCAHIIKIYNTFSNNENINLDKIYDKGYSSKKQKSGIGLWEVKRKISNSQNSQIFATIENNYFVQNIIIEA